jgi:hypothetical protein
LYSEHCTLYTLYNEQVYTVRSRKEEKVNSSPEQVGREIFFQQ